VVVLPWTSRPLFKLPSQAVPKLTGSNRKLFVDIILLKLPHSEIHPSSMRGNDSIAMDQGILVLLRDSIVTAVKHTRLRSEPVDRHPDKEHFVGNFNYRLSVPSQVCT
jgi:hypothetical protein